MKWRKHCKTIHRRQCTAVSSSQRLLLLAITCAALTSTSEAKVNSDELSRSIRLPVYHGRYQDQCYDSQIHRNYYVGEEWSHPYSGCTLSKCVLHEGYLYIDKYVCPSELAKLDWHQLLERRLYCRRAFGDRRRPFPDCCPQLVCKHYNGEHKLVPLPEDQYPWKGVPHDHDPAFDQDPSYQSA